MHYSNAHTKSELLGFSHSCIKYISYWLAIIEPRTNTLSILILFKSSYWQTKTLAL